jgi:hypothetical protein
VVLPEPEGAENITILPFSMIKDKAKRASIVQNPQYC